MDLLVQFHRNKCLFNCDKSMFALNIKCALSTLFSYNKCDDAQSHIFKIGNIVRCIICLHVIHVNIKRFIVSPFVICNNCCYECINKSMFIEFYVSVTYNEIYSSWLVYDNYARVYLSKYIFNHVRKLLKKEKLIDNSHKLIHRFYHTTMIIFLMAISDHSSRCNVLNTDIIFHILRFIY